MAGITNGNQRGTSEPAPKPVVVAEDTNPKTTKQTHSTEKRKHTWVEIFAVVFAALAFCAAGYQGWVSRDTERRQLRAYIGPDTAMIENINQSIPKITIRLKNFGMTPAFGVHAMSQDHLTGNIMSDQWNGTQLCPHNFGIIDPQHSNDMVIGIAKLSVDQKETLRSYAPSGRSIHVRTIVRYTDVFNQRHFRIFTYYYNAIMNPNELDDTKVIEMHISPLENREIDTPLAGVEFFDGLCRPPI